ncbi:helix-turn-helix domain-containing protein [Povalibacter sp.]|uniref:helix-turn-helix domain-containing protein n=1 Tax=Povalibacter sp. TaxID=1962978 RepID=UPI002F400203
MRPHARLQPWVVCYYYVEPDPEVPATWILPVDERQLILPDGHSEIVFALAGAFERWRVDDAVVSTTMSSSYVIGGRSHSVNTRSIRRIRLAGIKLQPDALWHVTQTPLGEFRDATLALTELNHRPLLRLENAVADARSVAAIRQLFDDFLLHELRDSVAQDPLVNALRRHVGRTCGSLLISQWLRHHQITERTLERRFIARMGITPKQYARVVRFKHSYLQFMSDSPRGASKRYLESYYDQSHFDREFTAFFGVTPAAMASRSAIYRTTVSDHLLSSEAK